MKHILLLILILLKANILIAEELTNKEDFIIQRKIALLETVEEHSLEISDQNIISNKKSPKKAILFSLLLPGTGELYANSKTWGYTFLILEATAFGGYTAFSLNESWTRRDYRNLAIAHAKVSDPENDYFTGLAPGYSEQNPKYGYDFISYEGPEGYNEDVRAFARLIYPDDADKREVYINENLCPEKYSWTWEEKSYRRTYWDLRDKAWTANKRKKNIIAVLFLNRVLSAVNAARCTRNYNKNQETVSNSLQVGFTILENTQDFSPAIVIKKSF